MLNGDRYEGEWMNDSKEGYGVHGYSDNSKYEGNWKDDKQHGKGTLVTSDGSTYQGMVPRFPPLPTKRYALFATHRFVACRSRQRRWC